MKQESLLRPLRFRFTADDDVKLYGDGWYVYDESELVRLPFRKLIALEAEVGRLADVMNGVRGDTIAGTAAGVWLAVHLADADLAGKFADFDPVVLLLEWDEAAPEADPSGPLDPTLTPSLPDGQTAE